MKWKRYQKAGEGAFYLRLGQNIYQLRKVRKISQEELAWRADCSQNCSRAHCSIDALFADILSREQTADFIVTASERALMHEVLRAVEEYWNREK